MMFKKVLSVALGLVLVFAVAAVAFAADGGAPIAPGPATTISFDTKTAEWTDFEYVGFHIWCTDGTQFFDWGAKGQRGTDEGDGIWSYDLQAKGISLDPEKQYAVIFYNKKGAQTYNLLFDATCLGDVAYADTTNLLENPEDSGKTAMPAYWTNQDPEVNGPELKITSIGNVVGECIPRSTTVEEMFAGFLTGTLENARQYSGLTDQEIIDNVGEGLGLGADMVQSIIDTSDVDVDWSYDASTLVKEPLDGEATKVPYTVDVTFGQGTASGDKDILTINYTVGPQYAFDTVTLTATPAEGWHFDSWSITGNYEFEEGSGLTDAVVTLKARGSIAAHAHFFRDEPAPGDPSMVRYTVDVTGGEGTAAGDKDVLSISYSLPPEYQYDTVTLTAVPAEGYHFFCWTIEGDYALEKGSFLNETVITVRAYDSIAAHASFIADDIGGAPTAVPYTVDVIRGEGTAQGDKDILIINSTVAPQYAFDTVTLTVAPAEGWRFVTWEIEGEYQIDGEGSLSDASLTVRAYDGIAAHAIFAETVAPTGIRGDADGDGMLTIMDATRIQRFIAELLYDGEIDLAAADADGDGKVTILDATRIQRVLAELCDMDGNPLGGEPAEPTEGELPTQGSFELPPV